MKDNSNNKFKNSINTHALNLNYNFLYKITYQLIKVN